MTAQQRKSIYSMTATELIACHNELAAERGVPLIETWPYGHELLCQGVTMLEMVQPTKAATEQSRLSN